MSGAWTEVQTKKHTKQHREDIEFAVELLPSFSGLRAIVNKIGVDLQSEVAKEAYLVPHICPVVHQQVSVSRKGPNEVEVAGSADSFKPRGFINVIPGFVHASLLLVNPPTEMDYDLHSTGDV